MFQTAAATLSADADLKSLRAEEVRDLGTNRKVLLDPMKDGCELDV